jgi:hypothetical protein
MAAPLSLDFPGGLIPHRLRGRAEHFISQVAEAEFIGAEGGCVRPRSISEHVASPDPLALVEIVLSCGKVAEKRAVIRHAWTYTR